MSHGHFEIELGEPQWAVMQGERVAHWFELARKDPDWAESDCGHIIVKPTLYSPGSIRLCETCARSRPLPSHNLSAIIVNWLNRPVAPPHADRTRPPAKK